MFERGVLFSSWSSRIFLFVEYFGGIWMLSVLSNNRVRVLRVCEQIVHMRSK